MSNASDVDILINRKKIYKILKTVSMSEDDILKIWPENAPLDLILHAKDETKEIEFRISILVDQSKKETCSCVTADGNINTSLDFDNFIKFINMPETILDVYAVMAEDEVNFEIFEESDYIPNDPDYGNSSAKVYKLKIPMASHPESDSNEEINDEQNEDLLIETPSIETIHARAIINCTRLSNVLSRSTQFDSKDKKLILSGINFCTDIILHAVSSNGFEAEYRMIIDEHQSVIEKVISNDGEEVNMDSNCAEIFEDMVDNNNCYVEVFFIMPKCKMDSNLFSEANYNPWHNELNISAESCICTLIIEE